MSNRKCVIEKDYSFNSIQDKAGLPDNQTALTYYADKLQSATNLLENIPIFLDTNILLRAYSIAPKPRALLFKFFLERKDQIVLTKQIEQEFIRNRKQVIKTYKNLPDAHLKDTSDTLAKFLFELKTEQEETEQLKKSKIQADELLDLMAKFEQIDNLSTSEKSFLKQEFDCLSSTFNPQKLKEEKDSPHKSFPGKGDILEKPKFPYGDYFIYHEMLKYSYERDRDVLFLTFDVAKGDWLKSSKEAHAHYIHKTFALNGKMIFILNANTFFENLYSTSFDALIPLAPKVENYVVKSKFEEALTTAFRQLEQRIRKFALQLDMDADDTISAKYLLEDLNYEDNISNEMYYELIGIWSIRDGLMHGDMETIRKAYTPDELEEILSLLKDNIRLLDKLILSSKK